MKKPLSTFLLFAVMAALTLQCKSQQQKNAAEQFSIDLREVCQLPDALIESSGIAIEGSNRIWSHEDSGNSNEIYCFDTTGTLLRTIEITNVQNIDWEDLAVDNEETWYINDAGNNNNNRNDLAIYKIPAPETITGNTVTAGIISFTLEDQNAFPPPSANRNFDIEAIVWHADSLFLFTKDRSNPFTGITKMYVLPDSPGNHTARLADSYFIGITIETGRITSADINHHTGELILLTNAKLISFSGYPGKRFFDGEVKEYEFTSTPGQNESIAFVSNSKLYMTEEGSNNTAGWLYEIKLPETQVIENPAVQTVLNIFPNPVTDKVKITCSFPQAASLEIINAEGRLMKNIPFNKETTLDIGFLKPGVYVVSLISEKLKVSQRLIKL
ncbi:MAG: T9SS type A sorting domain-containing protein [Lentimicrobium sp.]|nr:T9SS type A sorting domain-containing protein [Lentimicrobium sp.]